MKKYILIILTIVLTNLSLSQSDWDGRYPWYSADRYGDIRRGLSLMSFSTEVYYLNEVKNINKFQKSIDTLIFSDDKFLKYFFDFENKKVTVINLHSKTTEVYDVLKIKKRKINKEKTDGVFTLKIKKGKTKINYYINTYDRYFCKVIYSKEEKMGVVLSNDIDGTSYKTDEN
jgi:hypothetical protein